MRATFIALAVLLTSLTGCESMRPTVKADNPVIGPPPPRVARAGRDKSSDADPEGSLARSASSEEEEGGIRPVSRSFNEQVPYDDELVVAKVNGSPIFARELFESVRPQLQAMHAEVEKRKGTPEYSALRQQERKIREDLIRKALPDALDRRMIVLAIRGSVKDAQFKQIEEMMEANYKEVESQQMKKMEKKVSTPDQFRDNMRAAGYDPDQFKQTINENFLSGVYFSIKGEKSPEPSRADLLAYYREHKDDYYFPDQVKWQQIQVLHTLHGGKDQARERIDQAVDELLNGAPFPDVARKYSDGITADEGGQWNWMKRNALADKELENRLFTMPIGEVSPVVESDGSYQVVVVVDRKEEGYQPFEDVQSKISKSIVAQHKKEMVDQLIEDLRKDTVVWTIFDDEKAPESNEPESLEPLTSR